MLQSLNDALQQNLYLLHQAPGTLKRLRKSNIHFAPRAPALWQASFVWDRPGGLSYRAAGLRECARAV